MWKTAYAVLMLASVFCSDSPKDATIPLAICLLAFFALFVRWIAIAPGIKISAPTAGLLLFMAAILVSLPISQIYDTPFKHWMLRGAAPLLFLSVYFLLPIKTEKDANFVIKVLMAMFFLWAAKIFATIAISSESLLVRWTAISSDLLLPFNLAALCLLLLGNFPRWIRFVGITTFVILTIGAGYRIHFLILFAFFGWYLVRSLRQRKVVFPLIAAGFFAGCLVWFLTTEAGDAFTTRFQELHTEVESARSKEIKFAYEQFIDSPLVGKGLAYPVPLDVAFWGFEDYLAGIANNQGSGYTSVAYIHNLVMYLLMNLGLLGLVSFSLFVLPGLWKRKRQLLQGDTRTACRWALGSLLVFTLVAATITLFQYDLLIASLVAVLSHTFRPASYQTASVES